MGKINKTFKSNKRRRDRVEHDPSTKKEIGRLGKIQKSKRHKKIKAVDPFFEGERKNRNQKLRNLAPQNVDEQEIPRKVKFFMDHKAEFTTKRKRKRKKQKNFENTMQPEQLRVERGMSRPTRPVPQFVQKKGETGNAFLNRVERETQRVIVKSKLEDKFKVNLDETGDQLVVRKRGMSKHRKEKLHEKKMKKILKKKDKQLDKKGDFSSFKDDVKFGEVAMQPPSLTTKPRKAVQGEKGVTRPGRKSLLLKEILGDNAAHSPALGTSKTQRELGKSVKRKNLSLYQQAVMDSERQRAVELYRKLKGNEQKVR